MSKAPSNAVDSAKRSTESLSVVQCSPADPTSCRGCFPRKARKELTHSSFTPASLAASARLPTPPVLLVTRPPTSDQPQLSP